jgi:hypothetical protein
MMRHHIYCNKYLRRFVNFPPETECLVLLDIVKRLATDKHSNLFLTLGQPLLADQDPGRLLLLRVWTSGSLHRPRQELRRDGPGHDRRHMVGKHS